MSFSLRRVNLESHCRRSLSPSDSSPSRLSLSPLAPLSLSLSHGSMATRGDLRCRVPAQLLLPPPLVLSVQYPLEVIENGGRLELHLQVHEFRLTCHHGGYYPQAGRTVKSGNTNGSGSMCADCLLLLIRPRLRPVGLLPL
jgi:hypothetical protein